MTVDTRHAFAAGALAGAAVTALGAYCLYSAKCESNRSQKRNQQQLPVQQARTAQDHPASLQALDHDEVLSEQLTRNIQFFGLDKQKKIAKSFVVVIGLGVSKHTADVSLGTMSA